MSVSCCRFGSVSAGSSSSCRHLSPVRFTAIQLRILSVGGSTSELLVSSTLVLLCRQLGCRRAFLFPSPLPHVLGTLVCSGLTAQPAFSDSRDDDQGAVLFSFSICQYSKFIESFVLFCTVLSLKPELVEAQGVCELSRCL